MLVVSVLAAECVPPQVCVPARDRSLLSQVEDEEAAEIPVPARGACAALGRAEASLQPPRAPLHLDSMEGRRNSRSDGRTT